MPHRIVFGHTKLKITINLDPIMQLALGCDLEDLHEMTGRTAYHKLWPAVAMIYKPDQAEVYAKLEPVQYGRVVDAQNFLVDMLHQCFYQPDAIIYIESPGAAAIVPSTTQDQPQSA